MIRHISILEAQALVQEVLRCVTPLEVDELLEAAYQKIYPDL